MRLGSILYLAIGLVAAAACTGSVNTSADLACGSADGTCLAIPDGGGVPTGCGEQLPQPCDQGFVCCTYDPETTPPTPVDASTSADAATGG